MKLGKKLLIFGVVLIIAIAAIGCGSAGKVEEEETVTKIPVEVQDVRQDIFRKHIVLSGITKPEATVTVYPQLMSAEKIVSLNIKVGDKVTEGQTIAVVDQSSTAISLKNAQINYDNVLADYERNKVLFDSGAISNVIFEQKELALKQAQNSLDAQQLAYNNTIIKASISGVITEVHTEQGALASAQTPLAVITNIDSLEIDTSVNEMQVNKIMEGDELGVFIPSADHSLFDGKIESISPVMNESIKAYPVVITVENRDNVIKAGMYAEVEIVTDVHPDVVLVPTEAVITRDGASRVYVVEGETAVAKSVEIGLNNGTVTEILSGLSKGESIVTRGQEDLVDGDLVTVVKRGEN
ncbi:MAG: efflux RND transporter periplasmic adaptor subunit [Peptococcaceae bacterium]